MSERVTLHNMALSNFIGKANFLVNPGRSQRDTLARDPLNKSTAHSPACGVEETVGAAQPRRRGRLERRPARAVAAPTVAKWPRDSSLSLSTSSSLLNSEGDRRSESLAAAAI